jgi:hypothetical protein
MKGLTINRFMLLLVFVAVFAVVALGAYFVYDSAFENGVNSVTTPTATATEMSPYDIAGTMISSSATVQVSSATQQETELPMNATQTAIQQEIDEGMRTASMETQEYIWDVGDAVEATQDRNTQEARIEGTQVASTISAGVRGTVNAQAAFSPTPSITPTPSPTASPTTEVGSPIGWLVVDDVTYQVNQTRSLVYGTSETLTLWIAGETATLVVHSDCSGTFTWGHLPQTHYNNSITFTREVQCERNEDGMFTSLNFTDVERYNFNLPR